MARTRSRPPKPPSGRQAKAKSKKPVAAEVEVVEEAVGEGVDSGIAIASCVMLVAGILFLDRLLAKFDAGVFM